MRKTREDDFGARVGVLKTPSGRDRVEPSGPRRVSEPPVAETWRDILLRIALELPIDAGLDPLLRKFLDRLTAVLPTLALGACVVGDEGSGMLVCVHVPEPVVAERDPSRLFPSLPEERVFPLDDGSLGSTFHVACTASMAALSPFHLQVAERAADVLATAIARTRLYEENTAASTALLTLKARLAHAEKLASLGQIVAGVVHELNNPLTSILAYSQYLTKKLESGAMLDAHDTERLNRISEAAERVLKFSRDLVTYARPTLEPPTFVRLDEIVDKALIFCEHEFSRHDVSVEKLYGADVPELVGVPGQLIQVFVNLFTNAVHAMSESGGVLRVTAEPTAGHREVVIQVLDNGPGILPEHLPQVFEPFFTTKPGGRGTGLGLSIVRDILAAHGGTIGVRSAPGEGTTFRLSLPLALRS